MCTQKSRDCTFPWVCVMIFETISSQIGYLDGVKLMEEKLNDVLQGQGNRALLLEHVHGYTCGTGSMEPLSPAIAGVPVYRTDRGGKITYHGPGQRVVYPIVQLGQGPFLQDVRWYVRFLQEWIIQTLWCFGIVATGHPEHVGVWVENAKIASIGIRVRRWVAYHGFCVNVNPDLDYFRRIEPCGLKGCCVTSMERLGTQIALEEFDVALEASFAGALRR